MKDPNETSADIIAEMETERPGLMNAPINTNNLYYARRLKAALERERCNHAMTLNELLDVLDETVRFVVHDSKTGLHTDVCVVNPLGGRSPVEEKQLKALGARVVCHRGVGELAIMDSHSHVSITVE